MGVEEIKQSTFEDLVMSLLDIEYKLADIETKFYQFLDYQGLSVEYREKLQLSLFFKGSMIFKNIIDRLPIKLLLIQVE